MSRAQVLVEAIWDAVAERNLMGEDDYGTAASGVPAMHVRDDFLRATGRASGMLQDLVDDVNRISLGFEHRDIHYSKTERSIYAVVQALDKAADLLKKAEVAARREMPTMKEYRDQMTGP